MPPREHALLSASSANRWLHCPPSVRLTEDLPEKANQYMAEGTEAHALCEQILRASITAWRLGDSGTMVSTDGYPDEMVKSALVYRDFIHDLWAEFEHEPSVFIEQRVDTGKWVPGGFGTCDCLLIGDGILHIVDFKYGKGVPVSVQQNPQLMYYALGAYDLFRMTDAIETVRMSIVQPRIQSEPETAEMPMADLLGWANGTLKPAAELAWQGGGERNPGEWCRWCGIYPRCRAWKDKYDLDGFTIEAPPDLTDEEIGRWLHRLQGVAQYAKDLENYVQQQMIDGRKIPGWKLVEGRSVRKWIDQEAAFHAMEADGIDEAMLYTREPISLTAAEKLMGKKRFAQVMAGLVKRDPGAPKLADAADTRPEYNPLDGFNQEE